jgi:hypothetical protein
VNPVPDPLLFRKSGSSMNRTRNHWICSRNSDHCLTEAVVIIIIIINNARRSVVIEALCYKTEGPGFETH